MRISFVIPAHNEEAYLGKCLDSIFENLKKNAYDAEVVVVNNASTDRTEEIAKRYKNVKLVNEPVKGLPRTRRTGFLATTGDIIANVDADTMLTPNWLPTVFREFERDPELVALSGPFIYYDLSKRLNFWVRMFYYISFLTYVLTKNIFRFGSMLQGGNFIVRRKALEAVGGFNPDIDFYGEDTDIALRLHRVGDVKFTFNLPIYASGRRLAEEGALTMGLRYGLNYFWMIFFKRPFSKTSIVMRPRQAGGQVAYRPRSRIKEWLIASGAIVVLLLILGGAGYIGYRLVESGVIQTISLVQIKAEADKLNMKITNFQNTVKSAISTQINESR